MAKGHFKARKGKNGITSYQLVVEVEPDPITGKRNRYYKTVKVTKRQVAEALHKFKKKYSETEVSEYFQLANAYEVDTILLKSLTIVKTIG